jgi:succinoglycan biosynthesis transport protein ExoP
MDQLEIYPANSPTQPVSIGRILWRRKWTFLSVFVGVVGLVTALAFIKKPRYDATAQLIVTARGAAPSTATESNTANDLAVTGITPETPQTQIGMIMSDGMMQRTLDQLKNDALAAGRPISSIGIDDPVQFEQDFQDLVKVVNPLDTNLVEITVSQHDAKKAATWANAIAQAFVQWKKELAQQTAQDIASSLKVKVNRARDQVAAAERVETAFKQRHNVVDMTEQQKNDLDLYAARETDVHAAQEELAAQEHRLAQLQSRLSETNKAIANSSGVRDDLGVAKLQSDLTDLEVKRAAAAQQYTAEYPNMLGDMDAQIRDMKNKLATAIEGTLTNKTPSLLSQQQQIEDYKQSQVLLAYDRAKLAAAVRVRDQIKKNLDNYPKTLFEYTRVFRNADLARQTYAQLQLALNQAQLAADTAVGNVQVTQAATPPLLPAGLTPIKLIVVGVLLGLLLAAGAVLLTERADHRIRTVDRARYLVGGPVIGMLPPVSRRQIRRLLRGQVPPEVVEAYSLARANMSLALRNTGDLDLIQQQVIMVTSALPGEGKSITASELAKSTARSGKTVILVDADMRRPSQGKLFHREDALGLAEVLADMSLLSAALGAPVSENLFLLQSGHTRRNPTELISHVQMGELIARLKGMADVVILDAPACALVADPLLIAPHVDCILQVISLGVADEDLVRDTSATLQAAAPKTMAFFINRAPRERTRRRYRSYYYHAPHAATNGNGHKVDGAEHIVAALPGAPPDPNDTVAKS